MRYVLMCVIALGLALYGAESRADVASAEAAGGCAGGAAIGAKVGSGIGIVGGPFVAMAGTIPGAVIGCLTGALGGSVVDDVRNSCKAKAAMRHPFSGSKRSRYRANCARDKFAALGLNVR